MWGLLHPPVAVVVPGHGLLLFLSNELHFSIITSEKRKRSETSVTAKLEISFGCSSANPSPLLSYLFIVLLSSVLLEAR